MRLRLLPMALCASAMWGGLSYDILAKGDGKPDGVPQDVRGLFAILYTAEDGTERISGMAGPLPYGEVECQRRIEGLRKDVSTILRTKRSTSGKNEPVPEEDLRKFATWRYECERRDKAPEIRD